MNHLYRIQTTAWGLLFIYFIWSKQETWMAIALLGWVVALEEERRQI